ncbi:tripartite tricarboxylate transporter permease [Desulfococcaceae bacterium HSG7]|nr:tripartite tricarboxylate transporter permease [Desulfococcaceae bacterium HSG9]MDM8556996.1 tripartite tricarboxylate transporter permease [Desulfococcaceae bacterium HSG7]
MWDGLVTGMMVGIQTTLIPFNIAVVLFGCFVGSFIGMLPGLGPITAVALMIPVTYGLEPSSGMVLLAGVYYGAIFGGSTCSILINAPGEAATVATAFDGYPLAQKGYPGKALAIAAYSSFSGGTIAVVLLMLTAPAMAHVAKSFQSCDYFALMVLGLTAVSAFAGRGGFIKALLMTVVGLMLATIGTDQTSGVQRFTFGTINLLDGLSFVMLAMATFAITEALMMILKREDTTEVFGSENVSNISNLKVTKKEFKKIAPTIGRCSLLGFFIGALPGAGATLGSFLSYGMERNLAKSEDKKEFGKGSIIGLSAPETGNNAASSGSFVPLLTLGIPGSGTTAVMLGALIAYGIEPGPRMFVERPEIFWTVIMSMYLGNVFLLVLNLPLIPYFARLLAVPRTILIPAIAFFSIIGVYLVTFNTFDIYMMIGISTVALLARMFGFPMAPILLGFILGGLMEDNLRRSLIIYDGSLSFLWERPITLTINLITIAIFMTPLIQLILASGKKSKTD